ncbi:MAG: heavy metal translocating P-type ATPase [Pseudomonadota bacterium]
MILEIILLAGGVAYLYKKKQETEFSENSQYKMNLPAAFSTGMRRQQLADISSDKGNSDDVEKEVNRYLSISLVSLGMTIAGALIYPPLNLLSLPGLIYVCVPWIEDSYVAIFKEHRLRMAVVDLVLITGAVVTGQYFAAVLIALFSSLSKKLLIKAEDHSLSKLYTVFAEQPRFVWLLQEQTEVRVPFESLRMQDIIVVHAGETVPIDGTVTDGQASIDQCVLTGEFQPAEKEVGDQVFASTIVLSGSIHVQVKKTGQDTVSAQVADILNKTADFRHDLQWQWMEFVDRTALPTLSAGALTWPVLGPVAALNMMWLFGFGYSMKIIAPTNLLNFLNVASASHILIKDGRALELLSEIDTIVFDKTGTLTQDVPHVENIYTVAGYDENELLRYAAAAEYRQTHPVALAIIEEASKRELMWPEIESAQVEIGYGIRANLSGQLIRVGSVRYMEREGIIIPHEIKEAEQHSHHLGHSLICVATGDVISGAIELVPTIRPEAKQIISGLRQRGMSMIIISGDHERPTRKLADDLGIERYFAGTLPEHKADLIAQLQSERKSVCFVGDGINDAIALKQADVSVSLRGASTIATDTAQIILMDESLRQLDELFNISQNFNNTMKKSFRLALVPVLIAGGGIFLLHFGLVSSIFLYYTGVSIGVGHSFIAATRHLRKPDTTDFD